GVIEQPQHDQHRIRAGYARLRDLARIEEEVLGEDRAIELGARAHKVIQRAAEECTVAQDAEPVRDAGVLARDRSWVHIRTDHARRRRGFLDFEDEPGAGLSHSLGQASVRRLRLRPERVDRYTVEPRRKLYALRRRNRSKTAVSHGWPRRNRQAPGGPGGSASPPSPSR